MTPPGEYPRVGSQLDFPRLDSGNEAPKCPQEGLEPLLAAGARDNAKGSVSRPDKKEQQSNAKRLQIRKRFRPLLPVPVGEQAHFPQTLPRRQVMQLDFLQILPCR